MVIILGLSCCVLIIYMTVRTSILLSECMTKRKLPVYMTIWIISLSYLLCFLVAGFVYVNHHYMGKSFDNETLSITRDLCRTLHASTIFLAIVLIIYHTQKLNLVSIRLCQKIQYTAEFMNESENFSQQDDGPNS